MSLQEFVITYSLQNREPQNTIRLLMVVVLSSDSLLRVGRVMHGTSAEGPGLRTAVWVQGCSIQCKGCINPHLFSIHGGHSVDPQDLVAKALERGVEGLTLLGGEPFDQALACAALSQYAKGANMGVICFTGYSYEYLKQQNCATELLDVVDLLVDGPYMADRPERERALVGSTNQRFIHLTDRYAEYDPVASPNRVEFRLGIDGSVEAAGFLTREELDALGASLGSRRAIRRPIGGSSI